MGGQARNYPRRISPSFVNPANKNPVLMLPAAWHVDSCRPSCLNDWTGGETREIDGAS
jgi:hypothetical protein